MAGGQYASSKISNTCTTLPVFFLSFFYYLKPLMKELKCSNQTPVIHSTVLNVRHQHVCQINILRYFRSKVYDSILSNITPLT